MPGPLVSIVMPSFNQARFIARSIDCVFAQDHVPIELIIADGGSDDGTLDLLRDRAARYPGLRWQSEPDTGPANAINKALTQVRGEIIGWLNSDDLYAPGAVSRAVAGFDRHRDWIMCYGRGEHIDADDHRIGAYPTQTPDIGLTGFAGGCFICQPTVFFKTALTSMIGPLDETQKTSFDYEYWLRVFDTMPTRIGFIDAVQAQSRLHDDCITLNNRRRVAVEGVQLSHRFLGRAEMHWISTYLEDVREDLQSLGGPAAFEQHVQILAAELADYLDPAQTAQLLAASRD